MIIIVRLALKYLNEYSEKIVNIEIDRAQRLGIYENCSNKFFGINVYIYSTLTVNIYWRLL